MPEQKRGSCFRYDIIREGDDVILRVDCSQCNLFPSLEDNPVCMAQVCDMLVENAGITRITFYQKQDYDYDYEQTSLLKEIAILHNQLIKQKSVFSYSSLGQGYAEIQNIVFNMMKADPIAAYIALRRLGRREHIRLQSAGSEFGESIKKYISVITYLIGLMEKTRLIRIAKPRLAGYRIGDRSIYREIFKPSIKPDFMFTKLMASYPQKGEEISAYNVENTEVTIFRLPDTVQYLYHITPPEFRLSEDKYELLDSARKILSEHKPRKQEFIDPERMRQVFFNVGHDLLEELALKKGIKLRNRELNEFTNILVRYTVGFGLIEVLLQDDKVQDITINSPMGRIPMFIVHQEFSECITNIVPTATEGESWASKLRMTSGRPLDEANPILDTELLIPGARARVAVISPPLNPTGLAYAFRRHRERPWTLPLFIKNKMLSPLSAGVLSFMIDGARTMLISGTRSAGKTSLLGALMTEIMRKYRQITIEDTLELPVSALRKLNYNIQSMKVASAMTRGTTEVSADEGIRATLRMGDSCLIIGEVRSTEAKALYEAMRIGAMANTVIGTIHGDSPYGVFDRVVNDLQVPRTSFKAIDVIVVANPIRTPDGLHRNRRVTQLTEVGKFWKEDPLLEKGFRDLFKYNSLTDSLEPTADLVSGESDVLKAVASNVKEWANSWDAVWDNILIRAKMKEELVSAAEKYSMPEILEAQFVVRANDEFHKISDKVIEENGLDSKRVMLEWNDWLKRSIKSLKVK